MSKKLKHGKIMVFKSDDKITATGLECETDFLSKSQIFTDCLIDIEEAEDASEISSILDNLRSKAKEEISINCGTRIYLTPGNIINYYLHHDERKVSIVTLKRNRDKDDKREDSSEDFANMAQLAKDIAMHVVAFSPDCLSMDDVDWSKVDLEIPENMLSKPPAILEKIAKGKKIKYAKEHVLYNQPYAKDLKKTVEQVIAEFNKEHKTDVKIADYCRMEV